MGIKRKYMAEAGLAVSLNHFTLVPANMLSVIEESSPYKFHLYSILCGDKVYFDENETRIVTQNGETGLKIGFFSVDENNNKHHFILPGFFSFDENKTNKLDYSKVRIEIVYPNDLLKICIDDAEYFSEGGFDSNERKISAQNLFFTFAIRMYKELKLKVLYVGQSYGTKGNRTAFSRLSAHSTYQKILSDLNEKYPNKALYIYLMEINYSIMASMDPTQETIKNEEEDNAHLADVICNLPVENQVINITEAAMINYFKPEYNKMYVDNFPDKNHKGYKQYYDLDYNSLTVEVYPEFDDFPPIIMYSDAAELKTVFDFIEYRLYNDNKRKSMYDIFN